MICQDFYAAFLWPVRLSMMLKHIFQELQYVSAFTRINLIRQVNNKDNWDVWKVRELWKHYILSFSKHSLETNLKIISLLTFCTDKEILLAHHISRVCFWLWWERKNHERQLCMNESSRTLFRSSWIEQEHIPPCVKFASLEGLSHVYLLTYFAPAKCYSLFRPLRLFFKCHWWE